MRRVSGLACLAAFAATIVTFVPAAFAVPAPTPNSTQPGIIMRGMEKENRSETSDIGGVFAVPEQAPTNTAGLSAEKLFVLQQVVLDKPNVYSPDPLPGMYDDLIGKKVSFADLAVIADRMTKKYREDGYIFSRAVLVPQKITNGVVHLRAVEGRILHIQLVGDFSDRNNLIHDFANQISTTRPANSREIERYLLLINDLPGVSAKSFIKPSVEQGGGDLVIDVQEKPIEGSVSVDNRGSAYLGPYRGTAVAAFNDVFGIHDRTTLRGILTSQVDEMKFGDITHEEQIGTDGGRITLRAALTDTAPGGNVASQDISGKSQSYDVEGLYPLVRTRQYNVNLLGGFNLLNAETDVTGIKTADDKVRTLRAGTRVDFTDSYAGVNQLEFWVTQGIHALGASDDGVGQSRANGHHDFTKATATVTRVQQLYGPVSAMVSASGQVANQALLASEEFSVGGPAFGRGYDAGELSGDSGYAAVAELRYGGNLNGEVAKYLESYQFYTFVDYGQVRNMSVTPGLGESAKDSLTSTGVGLRVNAAYGLTSYVELDKPINKPVASEGNNGSRFFFSVLKRF